jgi:predicted ATPase/DNA-binding CsgD family transcriptional regulator
MDQLVPATSFIGRRSELAHLRPVLASARLLTLVGPAGTGKTRLALELARRAARPTEVVAIADLAALTDGAQLDVAVAAAFGLAARDRDVRGQLIDWLRDRAALLVLDNCEHLLRASADLAAASLAACPRLRILATSRQALGITGETTWAVPPLALPDESSSTPDSWERSDAVRLFAERARLVAPTFTITEANAAAVIGICRSLDGLPLAIELATSRMRNLAFADLRRGLVEQLRLLAPPTAAPGVGAPDGVGAPRGRHDTMRAAIEWSQSLLDERERRVFRRLAVFSGGFDSHGAEAVCADEKVPVSEVLPIVSALVDSSLAQLTGSGAVQRYSLLEVIRQYARERLTEAGELDHVEELRAMYIATLFETFGPHRQEQREEALTRIFAEHANVRGAMDWLLDHDVPTARRILAKAWLAYVFLRPGIDPSEIEGWLVRALDTTAEPDELRARMLIALAQRRFAHGDRQGSESAGLEALRVAIARSDDHAIGGAHHRLAISRIASGDVEGALEHFAEAIAHYRTTVLPACAFALAHRGQTRSSSGDLAGARMDFAEALSICDAHPHLPRLRAVVRTMQGEHLVREDARAAARDAFAETLRTYLRFGAEVPVARALFGLAQVAAGDGQAERAIRLAGGALEARTRTGDTWPPPREGSALALAEQRAGARAEDLRAEGRRWSMGEAVSFALGDREASAGDLSRREREVAGLVAQGLTSRRISERLRITERTAETHVEHILVKLGLRSRAEISRWATEHGIVTNIAPD